MLPGQPLRFVLADDPGAGEAIMAGVLMKEPIARLAREGGKPRTEHSQIFERP